MVLTQRLCDWKALRVDAVPSRAYSRGMAEHLSDKRRNGMAMDSEPQVDPHFIYAKMFVAHHRVAVSEDSLHGFGHTNDICTWRYYRDAWWNWDGFVWVEHSAGSFKAMLTLWCAEEHCTTSFKTATAAQHILRSLLGMKTDFESPFFVGGEEVPVVKPASLIVGCDGHRALEIGKFFPKDPSLFVTHRLPYDISGANLVESAPKFQTFLERIQPDPEIRDLLQEWIGYCLVPSVEHQTAMFWEGTGANGKSVLIEIIHQLLGSPNCSSVPLGDLGKRFQALPTVGKLVNFCTDTAEIEKHCEGKLKAYIGGDVQYVDVKCRQGFSFVPTARLIVAFNDKPRFFDRSKGFWRRMLHVTFPVEIPSAEQDTSLMRGSMPDWPFRDELSAIFSWALVGLKRLTERGKFDPPASCLEAAEVYRQESNPVVEFLQEMCVFEVSAKSPRARFYQAYRGYCESLGFTPLGVTLFRRELERYARETDKPFKLVRPRGTAWHFKGIRLRSPKAQVSATVKRHLRAIAPKPKPNGEAKRKTNHENGNSGR